MITIDIEKMLEEGRTHDAIIRVAEELEEIKETLEDIKSE